MPIYEYHCRKCDSRFEKLELGCKCVKCPHCGSPSIEKVPSAPAVHFKGDGWTKKGE